MENLVNFDLNFIYVILLLVFFLKKLIVVDLTGCLLKQNPHFTATL